ncbi:MAG: hypothetical protein M1837_001935 [Sclerophora amabilis]|nr:MAG: hypothetical protein M1837_001935 [Sclerophora amabilis]
MPERTLYRGTIQPAGSRSWKKPGSSESTPSVMRGALVLESGKDKGRAVKFSSKHTPQPLLEPTLIEDKIRRERARRQAGDSSPEEH